MRFTSREEHLALPERLVCWEHDDCQDLECRCPCHHDPSALQRALVAEQGLWIGHRRISRESMTAPEVMKALGQVPEGAPVQVAGVAFAGMSLLWSSSRPQASGWVELGFSAARSNDPSLSHPRAELVVTWLALAWARARTSATGDRTVQVRILSEDETCALPLHALRMNQHGVLIDLGPQMPIES